MDSSYPPAPQQRSPTQHFSSDSFSRTGSISHLSSYTPTEHSPFASGPKNFQDPTENPFFRRQSVVEYAKDPREPLQPPLLQSMPTTKEESPSPDDDVHMKSEHDDDDDWRPQGASSSSGPGRGRGRKREVKDEHDDAIDEPIGLEPGADEIDVKTKFPVARIKRIMQADEDVGKVAQVTPVAVSKALELFMISIITSAASEARSRGQKRVGAAHLKQTILKNPKFDFLSEIAERVPDPSAKNAGSGDEGKGKAKGRRKKKDDGD